MSFKDIALPLVSRGIPCIPVLPNSKRAFLPAWQTLATTDLTQIDLWDAQYSGYNAACVATGKPDSVFFFEVDSPDVTARIKKETGQEIPATFRVRSSPGKGHFYFKHTPASLAAGNLSQSFVKNGDFSVRAENSYVVAPGSTRPDGLPPYIALGDDPIVPIPDFLVEWLVSQKTEKKSANVANDIPKDINNLVPHGYIHGFLLTAAGKLRNQGLSVELIEVALLEIAHASCAPPIDESKVRQIARSMAPYAPGQDTDLILTQATTPPVAAPQAAELPVFEEVPYPIFPRWAMGGTSIYENFVRPVCDQNSRVDYFMWIPAAIMLLNYVGTKVKIKGPFGARPFKGSIYSVLIGRKGKSNKSSSVKDAMNFFNFAGVLSHNSRDLKSADGKVLTWTIGSPEGLGLQMQKVNCKNALLYYDELSKLVSKAGIDSSALTSDLLTMHESDMFSNSVKSSRDTFTLGPDTYCTSLIACTTDKKFAELWSHFAGEDTGLDDRFFFVLQPEPLPESRVWQFVNTNMGAIETKKLIDKAVLKGEYEFDDSGDTRMMELVQLSNRYAARAEKWALAMAVDLGRDTIDSDCVERAAAIVKYEISVKKYLKSYEATTREGQIQQDVRRTLEMNKGRMTKRELLRALHADRHGTSLWNQAYGGLLKNYILREEGDGSRANPLCVQLLLKRDLEDDDE